MHVRFGERTRETGGGNAVRRPCPTQPVLRLLDRTRLYLHAVVDNYSRRILAWQLAEKLSPVTTCEVLAKAAENLKGEKAPVSVLTDGGVENVNDTVDEFLSGGILRRVLAQVEIVESNSLVEAWWRGLRLNGYT